MRLQLGEYLQKFAIISKKVTRRTEESERRYRRVKLPRQANRGLEVPEASRDLDVWVDPGTISGLLERLSGLGNFGPKYRCLAQRRVRFLTIGGFRSPDSGSGLCAEADKVSFGQQDRAKAAWSKL